MVLAQASDTEPARIELSFTETIPVLLGEEFRDCQWFTAGLEPARVVARLAVLMQLHAYGRQLQMVHPGGSARAPPNPLTEDTVTFLYMELLDAFRNSPEEQARVQQEKGARDQRRRDSHARVGARSPHDSEGAVKRPDQATKKRFQTLLAQCFGVEVRDSRGGTGPETEHFMDLLGGEVVFRLIVANGASSLDKLQGYRRAAARIAEQRKEVNEAYDGGHRKRKAAHVSGAGAVQQRHAAKQRAKNMLHDSLSMKMATEIAGELGIRYIDEDGARQPIPIIPVGHGVCRGHIWGPFEHGAVLPLTELAACFKCRDLERTERLLCAQCRNDRPLAPHPGERRCLSGSCPAHERSVNGASWNTGCQNLQTWSEAAQSNRTRALVRIEAR